ncbi:site-specific DNA recombinase [Thermanaeromonas toyohensis ToBE]|uniref:Site-specific DNA recombinase n=1 Tax=Thermanaeromonas toyohensis ToBE TaxID=698762 RepID=A0A1W1VZH1_9FIRM|nr:recombinase family protein [Thermanaeromonas toyohensis]SMB98650.1 site-specific DNA recombinase [Thermanaeromonas toyohensis ToBE]
MQAAIYLRVSTEEQVKHGYSLAEQREACYRRAISLGAAVILEFADEGVSGATLDRPGLNALREAVQEGRIDVIIVRDPDRLSRRLAHQLLLTEEFEKAGVRLDFLDFTWQDTPEGRMFYAIRGAIAEFEKEKIRERMIRGKTQKARQGGIPIGFYNYGYNYDPERGKVSILEEEAAVVKNIFQWFVQEDIGVNGVAKRLNDLGIPTRKRQGLWHRMVVRQILTNPVYTGRWRYKDIDISVPPIIDPNLWEKAQKKLKEARRLWAGRGRHNYLLSGLITCADCGNSMTGVSSKWWGVRERRYTCRKNSQGTKNPGCRPLKMLLAEPLENVVWEQVCSWLKDPERLVKAALESSPQVEEISKEIERIEKHLKEVEKGKVAILDALASGLLELDDQTKNKLAELKRRKESLEQRHRELMAVFQGAGTLEQRTEELRRLAQEVLSRLNDLDFTSKKSLIRALVTQVIISGRVSSGRYNLSEVNITVLAKIPRPETDNSLCRRIIIPAASMDRYDQ